MFDSPGSSRAAGAGRGGPDLGKGTSQWLVMIAGLKEVNPIAVDEINQPMFLCNAAGPRSRGQVFQWLRFADTRKWIAHNGLNEITHPKRNRPIRTNPVAKVLTEFWLEDGLASTRLAWLRSRPGPGALTGGGQSPSLGGENLRIAAGDAPLRRAVET